MSAEQSIGTICGYYLEPEYRGYCVAVNFTQHHNDFILQAETGANVEYFPSSSSFLIKKENTTFRKLTLFPSSGVNKKLTLLSQLEGIEILPPSNGSAWVSYFYLVKEAEPISETLFFRQK
jgi:hypothetical protein